MLRFREIVADNWLYKFWLFIIPACIFVIGLALNWRAALDSTANSSSAWIPIGLFLLVAPITAVMCAAVMAPFIVYPLHCVLARRNGGPFKVGDRVQILNRSHRGTVSHVYSLWQGGSVRVALGDSHRESFTDIFSQHQLVVAK